jgi:hypothetical protein
MPSSNGKSSIWPFVRSMKGQYDILFRNS